MEITHRTMFDSLQVEFTVEISPEEAREDFHPGKPAEVTKVHSMEINGVQLPDLCAQNIWDGFTQEEQHDLKHEIIAAYQK